MTKNLLIQLPNKMDDFVFKSSTSKFLMILITPAVIITLMLANGFNSIKTVLLAVLFIWTLYFASRYLKITCENNCIILHKPFNFIFSTRKVFLSEITRVTIISFKGPTIVFSIKDNGKLSAGFIPSEKEDLLKFKKYLLNNSINLSCE